MIHHFQTFDAFLARVGQDGNKKNQSTGGYSTSIDVSDYARKWTESNSFEHALELMTNGWAEGRAEMKKLKGLLKVPKSHKESFKFNFSDSGDEVDVGLYVSGEPNCMVQFEKQYIPGSGRVVRILVNPIFSSGIQAPAIFSRGAAAFALCEAVEEAGLRAEIALHMTARGDRGVMADVTIPVKAAEQTLEPDRLAFLLAHPSICRRFMGRLFEQEDPEVYQNNWTAWGSPCDLKEVPADTVYFGCLSWSKTQTLEQCAAYVQEMLSRYVSDESSLSA